MTIAACLSWSPHEHVFGIAAFFYPGAVSRLASKVCKVWGSASSADTRGPKQVASIFNDRRTLQRPGPFSHRTPWANFKVAWPGPPGGLGSNSESSDVLSGEWGPWAVGYSRAVRAGMVVAVSGTVGVGANGSYAPTVCAQARRSESHWHGYRGDRIKPYTSAKPAATKRPSGPPSPRGASMWGTQPQAGAGAACDNLKRHVPLQWQTRTRSV